jgi:DNA polymerase-3 subunit beta
VQIDSKSGVLKVAMSLAATAAAKNASVRIMAAVGAISFSCAGNGFSIRVNVSDINVDEAGAIHVNAGKLGELLSGFASSVMIKLKTTTNAIMISSGRGRYTLPEELDPPEMLSIGADAVEIQMPADELLYLLDVVAAVATDRTRFNLQGTCLQTIGGKLTATSTDGDKLLSASVAATQFSADRTCVIPSKSISIIGKLVRATKPNVLTLRLTQYLFSVSTPAFEFTTQMVGSVFPDWERVVPAAGSNSCCCVKSDLCSALARLSAVAGGEAVLVLVALTWGADDSALRVFLPRQPDIGEDFVAAKVEGRARIALSLPKLREMIDNFSCNEIVLEVSQDNGPMVLRGQDSKIGVITSCRWPREFSGTRP